MLLLNPAFLYAATWSFVTLLYAAHLSDMLEPLQGATIVLIVGSSLSFILGWVAESISRGGRLASTRRDYSRIISRIHARPVGRRLRWLAIAFVAGLSLEIAVSGGAPLLGLLGIGADILYTEFGIPGFHGLMNAFFYSFCAMTFARSITGPTSTKHKILLGLVSLAYPALGMSRQVLISLMLQYLIIYVSFRRLSPSTTLRVVVGFVAAFLIFGYLGDLRSGRDSIIALAQPTFDYPDWLPSAFIWFYIYVCTPLNNVNFNIGIAPHYFPFETIGTLIPSFARDSFLGVLDGRQDWELVSESFNVSSLLQSLVTDFGVVGTIFFTFVAGIAFSRLLRRSATRPGSFFATVVFLHGIALSFFANLLFHLVFLFQIATMAWLVRSRRVRR